MNLQEIAEAIKASMMLASTATSDLEEYSAPLTAEERVQLLRNMRLSTMMSAPDMTMKVLELAFIQEGKQIHGDTFFETEGWDEFVDMRGSTRTDGVIYN